MSKNYTLSLCLTLLLFLLISMPTVSLAQTTTPPPTGSRSETQLENLRSKAIQEIDRRVTSLTNLSSRINGFKHLSSDQKTTLSGQIQAEITNLQTLKTKIQGDTTLQALKTDVKSIVTSYRVYALFIPELNILAGADSLLTITTQATELANKLDSRIQEAKSQGKDVATLSTALLDMQAKIADAKKQANDASSAVMALTPEGYPGNKATLQTARATLAAGKKSLLQARLDAKVIIEGLRAFKTTTPPQASSSAR